MTPHSPSHSTSHSRVDDTWERLGLLAGDTRSQLLRWTALSILLRCPLILTPASRREAAALAGEAINVLPAMRSCVKDAIRCFRKRRYERCMRALDRFERLRRALETIGGLVVRAALNSPPEGRRHGHRR